jgi:spermidine synthase
MAEYFPSLEQIHYLLGDASDFPAYTSLPFDAICVDLYTESGYPNFVFDHLFWHKVRSGLEPEGVAIVNAFGLPAHLHPLIGETPQVQVIRAMQAEFRTVYALPYRRNMTLVGTSNTKPWPRKLNAVVDLRGVDSIIADLLPIRWALAQPVRVRDLPTAPIKWTN